MNKTLWMHKDHAGDYLLAERPPVVEYHFQGRHGIDRYIRLGEGLDVIGTRRKFRYSGKFIDCFCAKDFEAITGVVLDKWDFMEVHITPTGIQWGQIWEYYEK